MNLLGRLKQAEAEATPGPWEKVDGYHEQYDEYDADTGINFRVGKKTEYASEEDKALIVLFRNHAADLIRLVEAAHDSWYTGRDPQLKEALAPFLAEEDVS